MKVYIKFYNKTILMNLNDTQTHEPIFSLCLEALKRFDVIIVFSNLLYLASHLFKNERGDYSDQKQSSYSHIQGSSDHALSSRQVL